MSAESTGSSPSSLISDDGDILTQDPTFLAFVRLQKDMSKSEKQENGILNTGQPSTSNGVASIANAIVSVPTSSAVDVSMQNFKMSIMDMVHPADLPEYQVWPSYFFILPAIDDTPGRFLWIWFLGQKCPSIVINGEAHIPVELMDQIVSQDDPMNDRIVSTLLKESRVQLRYANQAQFYTIMRKCEKSRTLGVTGLSLVSRSALERVLGERKEASQRTACENDEWDDKNRVHVIHVNFIDLYDEWLEGDGVDEDPNEYGVHGIWYKNRRNMRSIKCMECHHPFTPSDFVVHHHYPRQYSTTEHYGLNTAKWMDMIQIHRDDRNEENLTAWRKYCCSSTNFGKRAYEEAEPMSRSPKRPYVEEDPIIVDDDEPMEVGEVEDGEELKFRYETYDEMIASGRKLTITDYFGPLGPKGIEAKNYKQKLILDLLCEFDQRSLEIFLLAEPEDVEIWFRDQEFCKRVKRQKDLWLKLQKDPEFDRFAGASFDPKTGEFDNLRQLEHAAKETKKEVERLAEEMRRLQTESKKFTYLEYLKKEQQLLKDCSKDAIRVISNIPLPPKLIRVPLPPPLPLINPLLNVNIPELLKQLTAAGFKLPDIKLPLPNMPFLPLPIPLPLPVPIPQLALPKGSVPSTSKVPATPTAVPQIAFPIVPIPIHKNSAPSLPVSKIVSPTLSAGPSTSARPSTSTPTTPVTPILPVLPLPTFPLPMMHLSPTVEAFRQSISRLFQTNPAAIATMPPLGAAQQLPIENLFNLLKTAAVKN